jgi:maleate cis-trans isomerase
MEQRIVLESAVARPSSATTLEAAFTEAAAGRRVKVRRGRQAVAVVPVEDLARLEELDAEEDRLLGEAAQQAKAAAEAQGETPVPWEEADQRLGEL